MKSLRLLILLAVFLAGFGGAVPAFATGSFSNQANLQGNSSAVKIFVDTDIGVDDAVAIAYLLKSRNANVLGFSTVAGNTITTSTATASENAANNLLTLLDVMRISKPVTIGASAPLQVAPSLTGAMVHGLDGLWFAQVPHNLSTLSRNAPAAIAEAARNNPGMTLLTLGPLTNVAQAVQQFPSDLQGVKIISLIGSRGPGNSTAVSEFNAFYDPHAADIVISSGLDITLITLDAFTTVTFDSVQFPQRLAQHGGAVGQFLAPPLTAYMNAQTQGAGGRVAIPDVVAAAYALQPNLGTATSALIDVSIEPELTRGQTVMAMTMPHRLAMIMGDSGLSNLVNQALTVPGFDINAEIATILAQHPDNAKVVLSVSNNAINLLVGSVLIL